MDDVSRIIESSLARASRFNPDENWWTKIRVRKGPKNHGVNRERAHLEKSNNSKAKHANEAKAKSFFTYKELVKKYWAGELNGHPTPPKAGD